MKLIKKYKFRIFQGGGEIQADLNGITKTNANPKINLYDYTPSVIIDDNYYKNGPNFRANYLNFYVPRNGQGVYIPYLAAISAGLQPVLTGSNFTGGWTLPELINSPASGQIKIGDQIYNPQEMFVPINPYTLEIMNDFSYPIYANSSGLFELDDSWDYDPQIGWFQPVQPNGNGNVEDINKIDAGNMFRNSFFGQTMGADLYNQNPAGLADMPEATLQAMKEGALWTAGGAAVDYLSSLKYLDYVRKLSQFSKYAQKFPRAVNVFSKFEKLAERYPRTTRFLKGTGITTATMPLIAATEQEEPEEGQWLINKPLGWIPSAEEEEAIKKYLTDRGYDISTPADQKLSDGSTLSTYRITSQIPEQAQNQWPRYFTDRGFRMKVNTGIWGGSKVLHMGWDVMSGQRNRLGKIVRKITKFLKKAKIKGNKYFGKGDLFYLGAMGIDALIGAINDPDDSEEFTPTEKKAITSALQALIRKYPDMRVEDLIPPQALEMELMNDTTDYYAPKVAVPEGAGPEDIQTPTVPIDSALDADSPIGFESE